MSDCGPLTETTTECTNIHFHYYCDDESTKTHIHYYRAGESALTWGRNMSSPMMVRVRRSGTHQANNEKLKNLRREEFISHLLVQRKNIFLNVVQTSSHQILISFCFSRLCTFQAIQFPIWQCQVHKRGTTSKNLTSVENGVPLREIISFAVH